MKIQCSNCKAVLKETDKFCSYCRTPIVNQTEQSTKQQPSQADFTDEEREGFLRDRKPANTSGCMIFILLPIIAACLWILRMSQ